jgi:hypothetical protein
MTGSVTIPNVNASSAMLLQMFSVTSTAAATRDLNHIGLASGENAQLLALNKLKANSSVNSSSGEQQHAGVMVVITKFDRANSVLGVYTQHEQLKPTYSAPAGSTTMYLFGGGSGASDATLVYAALWVGTDAEISDSQIQDLLDTIDGDELTIEKMEAGSFSHKWVVSIEGCPYLLSDAPSAAVLQAYAGRDWTQVLGGLFVEVNNDQRIKPFSPFAEGGTATIRVVDTDGTDVFGRYVWQRAGGDETRLAATIDRNDTTINVESTQGFDSSGEIHIGTECIGYTGTTATTFTGCTRGKYSPLGCALSGSGGIRFANHHRVGTDANHVQMNPVISTIPRVWLGRRVAIRLHTWDAVDQTINARAEAQLVFAGRITDVADDPHSFHTIIECDHVLSELLDSSLYRDQLVGEATEGMPLAAGHTFEFVERVAGSQTVAGVTVNGSFDYTANALTVVSGTPASTNEIQAGVYSAADLCEAWNRWLGEEKRAARILGNYSWSVGANTDGIRARCHWVMETSQTNLTGGWELSGTNAAMAFMGLTENEPSLVGGMVTFSVTPIKVATKSVASGVLAPFTTLLLRPFASRIGQEFGVAPYIEADNVHGTFFSQRDRMPASIKASCDPSAEWGLFLLDEKTLMVSSYDDATRTFTGMWLSPFQMPGNDTQNVDYIGRRADEPDAGPVPIRQVLIIEGSFSALMLEVLYSTGAAGYNHSTNDTLNYGLGVGIPGELLGFELERSLTNMPNTDSPLVLLIDEATTFRELLGSDVMFRWAFLRWKDQHLEFSSWKTPLNSLAVATLSESNKMLPAGADGETHRVSSQETNEHQYAICKIDYNRNFAVGRNGDYLKSVQFEDQTAVDDSGGAARTATLKLRNTFTQYTNTGSSVEQGLPEFMVHMPSISRSSRKIARTLAATLFESVAPGDIVTVTDEFARDPLTGRRGVNSRAAFVTRVAYDLGGSTGEPAGDARPMDGEIEVNFLDTQRGQGFAPSADIDDTVGSGGFSAGYNNGTSTIRCYEHHYSNEITVRFGRGTLYFEEEGDASYFPAGSKVLIIERDPPDPASPVYWERTVLSQSGNDIVLTSTLSAPAWDATKRYRVVPQLYSQVVAAQHDVAYQADTDGWVEDDEIPWHFSAAEEQLDFFDFDGTADLAEFVPDMCYGDGRPWDVGHEQAIARTINQLIDYKTAHQTPCLSSQVIGMYDEATVAWFTLFHGPIFVGTEHLSATVTRVMRVAPFYRSRTGGTAKVRITLMRSPPVAAGVGFLPGEQYRDSVFNDHYSQSAEYSTTSTTWQTGAESELTLDTKDLFFGFVYVLIEGQGPVECRGLGQAIEGPRVVQP